VALETCRLFELVRRAESDLADLREIADIRRELTDTMNRMLEAGQITSAESLRTRQQQLAALSDVSRARREAAASRQALARWLGVRPDSIAVTAEWQPPTPELPAIDAGADALVHTALSNRADVAALGWDARAMWNGYRQARAALWPWFSFLQAGYAWDDQTTDASEFGSESDLVDAVDRQRYQTQTQESEQTSWRIDAGLTLPIASWLGQEDDLRRAEYHKAQAIERRAILDLSEQIATCSDLVRQLAGQKDAYEAEAAPVADGLRQMVETAATGAVIPPEELARAREELVQARRASDEAAHSLNMAVIDLHAALGTLPVPTVELPERAW
jgi:outer membrane protein TolC